jgi:hypothetical protein
VRCPRSRSPACAPGRSRRARMPPWIAGCSVFTRPSSISATPVTSPASSREDRRRAAPSPSRRWRPAPSRAVGQLAREVNESGLVGYGEEGSGHASVPLRCQGCDHLEYSGINDVLRRKNALRERSGVSAGRTGTGHCAMTAPAVVLLVHEVYSDAALADACCKHGLVNPTPVHPMPAKAGQRCGVHVEDTITVVGNHRRRKEAEVAGKRDEIHRSSPRSFRISPPSARVLQHSRANPGVRCPLQALRRLARSEITSDDVPGSPIRRANRSKTAGPRGWSRPRRRERRSATCARLSGLTSLRRSIRSTASARLRRSVLPARLPLLRSPACPVGANQKHTLPAENECGSDVAQPVTHKPGRTRVHTQVSQRLLEQASPRLAAFARRDDIRRVRAVVTRVYVSTVSARTSSIRA